MRVFPTWLGALEHDEAAYTDFLRKASVVPEALPPDTPERPFIDRSGCVHVPAASDTAVARQAIYGAALLGSCVLLIRPTWSDRWELPGGGIEPGEEPVTALAREFVEETGCQIAAGSARCIGRGCSPFFAEDKRRFFLLTYLIFLVDVEGYGDLSLIDTSETREARWFDLNRVDTRMFNAVQAAFFQSLAASDDNKGN